MLQEIYLAGGCFWGMEKLFSMLPGVIQVISGYANGKDDIIPDYEKVCNGKTGYKEAIRVRYDNESTSLEALLFAYFQVIDPTIPNRQGFDKGTQYQTGIYYTDDTSERIIEKIVKIEKTAVKQFVVEVEPLKNFHIAEDYHQEYLLKNPNGYCHINPTRMKKVANFNITPAMYDRPAKEILRIDI